MTTQTHMLPVSWFLENVTSSIDMGSLDTPEAWFTMMGYKGRDYWFPELLEAIMAEGFTIPVCVRQVWSEYTQTTVWQMGNGHHRLVAALLLCLDEIPVVYGTRRDYMMDDETEPDGVFLPDMTAEDKEAWIDLLRQLDL